MTLFERAIEFAVASHSGAVRKGAALPYIVHPMEVAVIASRITDDEEVLAAAMLHDTVEDTDATMDDITALFGSRVAALVESDTEDKKPGVPKSESWRLRKEEIFEKLKAETDIGAKILFLSDKLSNMRTFAQQLSQNGRIDWHVFNQKDPTQHEWYYRTSAELLTELSYLPEWAELNELIDRVFKEVQP